MSNLNPLYLLETLDANGGQVSHKMARRLNGSVGIYARDMKDDGSIASKYLARARKTTGVSQQRHMDFANANVLFGRSSKAKINGNQKMSDRLNNRAMQFYDKAVRGH